MVVDVSNVTSIAFLREAIGGLQGSKEIDCASPTDRQWDILEDVQQTLMAPAELQQVLEGESYITGSRWKNQA